MRGYNYIELSKLGIKTPVSFDYGKSSGDILGSYFGYFNNLYWFI